MEAPIGKYVSQIIREEGTASNLMQVMHEAKDKNQPYFAYPLSENKSVIFRTPDVPVSMEIQKRFRERMSKENSKDTKMSRLTQLIRNKTGSKLISIITFGLVSI